MSETYFTLLGTSSGVPQASRVCSGSVLQCGNELLLLDCGGGVTSAFLRTGFDFRDVGKIVISHTHSDHVCELSLFLQGMYLARREGPVTVFLPNEFIDVFKSYLIAVYLFPERFPFDFQIQGYAGSLQLEEPTTIRAIPNSHLQKYQPYAANTGGANKLQSHSFIIETANSRLLYSADIGSENDILPHLEGVNFLVTELSHVDREGFLRAIKDKGIDRIIVTHLDGEAEVDAIRQTAQQVGVDNLEIASDGMRLTL